MGVKTTDSRDTSSKHMKKKHSKNKYGGASHRTERFVSVSTLNMLGSYCELQI
jgi:hypothetical protein